jgi:hypothetical protein
MLQASRGVKASFLLVPLLVSLAACGGTASEDSSSSAPEQGGPSSFEDGKVDSVPSASKLDTLSSVGHDGVVPLAEVSGLALRSSDTGAELLAIGDVEWVVAVAPLPEAADPSDLAFVRHDVSALFDSSGTSPSQWEAIDVDAEGKVFVLEERPGAVHVLSRGLDERLHTFELDVSGGDGWIEDLAEDWADEPNSRGEGLVLGLGGHLLVLKEKRASLIVEFGPPDDPALGYRRDDHDLRSSLPFPLPSGHRSRVVPLAVWEFRGKVRDLLPDMSDLAIGPDGSLFVVSGEARVLARIDGDLDPDDDSKISVDVAWKVPKRAKNPEGLVVLGPKEFFVASDQDTGDTLFRLVADD